MSAFGNNTPIVDEKASGLAVDNIVDANAVTATNIYKLQYLFR